MQMNESEAGVNVFDENDEDNFTVDFDQVEAAKREVLPKGDYKVVISKCDYKKSKSSNQPMWDMMVEVEDGEKQGKKVYTNLSFSPKALPITKGILQVIAPHLLQKPLKPKETADSGEMLGVKAVVRIDHDSYNGQPTQKITRWMPYPEENAFINAGQ